MTMRIIACFMVAFIVFAILIYIDIKLFFP